MSGVSSKHRFMAAVSAAAAIGFGVSYATTDAPTTPVSTTTIQACVKENGSIRIVRSAAECGTAEASLSWNIVGAEGPQGPTGQVGPAGPAGPAGADGANGTSGVDGQDGPPGADGADGSDGTDGANGANGAAGPAGPTGSAGPTGPRGPAGADGGEQLASAIYGPCGSEHYLLQGFNPNGSPRCASGSSQASPKVVYKIIPGAGHYYDSDPAVCPAGYKFIGATGLGSPQGVVFSSGGAFNPDNYIVDAFDNMYVDCTNPNGCVTTCLRMTFY